MAQPDHWSEQPPRLSAQSWATIRESLVRSTVPVGVCRSVLSFGIMRAPLRTYLLQQTWVLPLFVAIPAVIAWLRSRPGDVFVDRYVNLLVPMLAVWCFGFVVGFLVRWRNIPKS
jgi:hypothetical protein